VDNPKNSVLVIDDQETTIVTLSKILSPEYTVFTAKCGKDGIIAAEKFLPDVILLDILMMDMDGFAVISVLKSTELTQNIPVIFITSLSGDDNEAKGLVLGAADYITKPFTPAIVTLRVKNQIKLLEQMRMIEKLSMIDQVTNLNNRRSFESRVNIEISRALREKEPISILMIDIDFFKKYNDAFGHQQGDVALKTFSRMLPAVLRRSSDFAARWGGEEFVMLLPNTDSRGALEVAEHVRKRTEEMDITGPDDRSSKITVSIGVFTNTDTSCCIDEFISKADKALYDAKNSGRNRVSYFKE